MAHDGGSRGNFVGSNCEFAAGVALQGPHAPRHPPAPATAQGHGPSARSRLLQVIPVDESPVAGEAMTFAVAADGSKDIAAAPHEGSGSSAGRHSRRQGVQAFIEGGSSSCSGGLRKSPCAELTDRCEQPAAWPKATSRGAARPHARNLQSSLVSKIKRHLDHMLPDGVRTRVKRGGRPREPYSVGATLNSYRLVKAIEGRYRYHKDLPADSLKDDPMVDVLLMLRKEFKSSRSKSSQDELEVSVSSSARTTAEGGSSALDSERAFPRPASSWLGAWFESAGAESATAEPSSERGAQSSEGDAEFPPGSPWEGCEELAEEDFIDFLAESSQGWHDDAAVLNTSQEAPGAELVDTEKFAPATGRWGPALDGGAHDALSISTGTGSISSMTSSTRSDRTWSWPASGQASIEAGTAPFPGSPAKFLSGTKELPEEVEAEHVWEREFAERVRRSMQ